MDNGLSAAQISGTLNSTIRTALDVPADDAAKDFMNYFSGNMRIATRNPSLARGQSSV